MRNNIKEQLESLQEKNKNLENQINALEDTLYKFLDDNKIREMSEEEKKAIESVKKILEYWQTIVDIEDPIERDIEMSMYFEDMPFHEMKILLNLIEKQQKRNNELIEINKEHQKLNGELRKEIKRQGNAREIEEKYVEENYISKDKIREKIKKYDKIRLETKDSDLYDEMQDYIDLLIELLKEE